MKIDLKKILKNIYSNYGYGRLWKIYGFFNFVSREP